MSDIWIYHERQEALLCGQHALNNLVQACIFSPESLSEIAQQLDQMELNFMAQNNEGGVQSKDYLRRLAEGSGNVDPSGNFSIEVLKSALMNQYGLELSNIARQDLRTVQSTTMEGFICHRDAHWFAIRKIKDRFWNLNSTKDRPEQISHFHLSADIEALQMSGYSVFCVQSGLPAPCQSEDERSRGLPQYWWKEDDLIANKTNATTGATDPWRNVGVGIRLDGKPTAHDDATNYGANGAMSEEEMIAMAISESMRSLDEPKPNIAEKLPELPPEPSAGAIGAVRIQFRLPDGNRAVRRFLQSEPVAVLYTFVNEKCPSPSKILELRFGYPPQDLSDRSNETIQDAKLANESILCRYI